MSLRTNFSNNLNAIRSSRNLSITEFADELCIARSSLQNILNGNCNPRMDTINQISSNLNVDSITLLQSSYTPSQLNFAMVLLDSLATYRKLSEENRIKAADLFNQLIILLDSTTEESSL